MINWLRSLFRKPVPREVVRVSYPAADKMIRQKVGWRIASEEDHNASRTTVWLERDVPRGSAGDKS